MTTAVTYVPDTSGNGRFLAEAVATLGAAFVFGWLVGRGAGALFGGGWS